jgi:protein phosphatase 2C family protein 2/3
MSIQIYICVIRKKLDGEWLVALPDTSHIYVEEDMEFIILASDGLWDSFKR